MQSPKSEAFRYAVEIKTKDNEKKIDIKSLNYKNKNELMTLFPERRCKRRKANQHSLCKVTDPGIFFFFAKIVLLLPTQKGTKNSCNTKQTLAFSNFLGI